MFLRSLTNHATSLAITAAVTAGLLILLMEAGVMGDHFTLFLLTLVILFLAWISWGLGQQRAFNEKAVRQLRFIAERQQNMIRTIPGGYCLFTPQGLLREEHGVAAFFSKKKIAHFDELVEGIKEGPELVAAFRKLQLEGTAFTFPITVAATSRILQIAGRRFRIGREGPEVDVLWFGDSPALITKLKELDQKTEETETQVKESRTLIDTLRFPVWGRGADLNIVLCNEAYGKALDASEADVVEKQHELMSQTARGGSGRALAANALNRGMAETERRHVIIAGRRRLLEITEMPCAEKSGKLALIGFAIDVTSEEEKETDLQRHLAAHREVMEHLGAAVAVFAQDTRLEFYNRAYVRLWGFDEAYLDAHPTLSDILEELRTRRRGPEQVDFQKYKQEYLARFTSLLEPHEDLLYLPDGTSLRSLSVPHPFGGILVVYEDVTDRLALESSYNTLIAVQRETLDNLSEGIAVFGPDGKLKLHNPSFTRIWKLQDDFLSEEPHIADLLDHMKPLFHFGDAWDAFKEEIVSYTLDRDSHAGRMERVDGTVVDYLNIPLPDGAVMTSYLDVSDSVRAESALRANNIALATADRMKSVFVANVSYQLRTPLNTIMGFAEILTNQYFGTLNPRQLDYTRTIMDASKRLLLLINDVLDLATIEAGRMELNREEVPVADLLNSAKQMTGDWARQQELDMTIDCPQDIGSFVVDEQRLKQVLFNLISNAIKFTPAGGHITLAASRNDDWIKLSVADTGIGIPDVDRDRIFGKFERANEHMRQNGAGLGLSLVKNFIELHGGRVELDEVTEGTKINCFIPITPPPALLKDDKTEKGN